MDHIWLSLVEGFWCWQRTVCMNFASTRFGTLQVCKASTLLVLFDFGNDRLDKTNKLLDLFLHLVHFLLGDALLLCTTHTAFLLLQVGMEGSVHYHQLMTFRYHTVDTLFVL